MEEDRQNCIGSETTQTGHLDEPIDFFSAEIFGSGAALLVFIVLLLLGTSITGGLITGLLASLGFTLLFLKTRRSAPSLYALVLNYPLTADLISTFLFFSVFGSGTALGLIAASTFGLLNTVSLSVAAKIDPQSDPFPEIREKLKAKFFSVPFKIKTSL